MTPMLRLQRQQYRCRSFCPRCHHRQWRHRLLRSLSHQQRRSASESQRARRQGLPGRTKGCFFPPRRRRRHQRRPRSPSLSRGPRRLRRVRCARERASGGKTKPPPQRRGIASPGGPRSGAAGVGGRALPTPTTTRQRTGFLPTPSPPPWTLQLQLRTGAWSTG